MIAAAHQPAAVEQVALHDIRTDGGTQARAALNDETVAEYAANKGDELPVNESSPADRISRAAETIRGAKGEQLALVPMLKRSAS